MEQKLRTSLIGITISFSLLTLTAQAQTPTFTQASVVNAASLVSGPIAPGMVAAIMGSNLGDPVFFGNCMNVTPPLPTCSAVSVLVNGVAAPKIFDSASEVTFQVPFNIGGSTATIQVTSTLSGKSLSSSVVTVPVAPTAPGLFTGNGTGSGTGYYYDSSGLVPEYSQAVQLGDTVVLFATGFGATNPPVATGSLGPTPGAAADATVTMTINNQSVPVTFAGLEPGDVEGALLGYDEVVFTVPNTLTVPTGQLSATFPLVVMVGGVASQSVNLVVAAPPVTITSISPNPVPVSASAQTITVNGSGFESGLTLKLQSPTLQTTTVSGSSITFISATQFTAQITVGTAGSWGALVTNPPVNNQQNTQSSVFNFTVSGTVSGNGPTITSIVTTSSNAAEISQNTWIEVHGTNLANVTTTWSGANFSNGLPTTLGNVSATVDGKPCAIFYVSPTQVNILAPLDTATGSVPVELSTPNGTTAITNATELQTSPAFLVVDVKGHVAAEHLPSFSLLGPTSLNQPGYTFTPASPGESVTIYATGFAQTSPAFGNQLTNTGLNGTGPFPLNLPILPTVTIGNLPATVSFAGLVGPGLYQINLTIPASAPAGDLPILALYNGASTQSTAVITVQ
jgi:uncharacterized protein (TIGR03437 family)